MNNTKVLEFGALVYPNVDQADVTGPFEVLSRLPGARFRLIWKNVDPVMDVHGLVLKPELTFSEVPRLAVLVVPGGAGQEQLMNDEQTLSFISHQAQFAEYVFSVCTGALLCGAAGLLRGVKSTTHWAAFHLLQYFGAIPVNSRVVIDAKHISAAGVTAGLDGSLRLAALLCGEEIAQQIQLSIEYAPDPPFDSGTPSSAPSAIISAVRNSFGKITAQRLRTARQVADRLGIPTNTEGL